MKERSISLYPMKFTPLFREKPWGGDRFRASWGFSNVPEGPVGEAWLLSAVPGSETVVANGVLQGNTLAEVYEVFMEELTGERVYEAYPDQFPLLIKLLDANEWLSVQVHPNDTLAMERYGTPGKTEMWYILDAAPDATIISGFNRDIDRSTLVFVTENNGLSDLMHHEPVAPRDLFYTPAGRVHAIGPGILLAEIQQTSDVTYRLYDWGRTDPHGKPRETHLAKALDAIDFTQPEQIKSPYNRTPDRANKMLHTAHFAVNLIPCQSPLQNDYTLLDTCVVLMCTEGSGNLISGPYLLPFTKGEVILLPADTQQVEIVPDKHAEILEIHIPA